MSVPFGRWGFQAGEIAPGLFGHVDLAKFSIAASTMRNVFVSYRGGGYSRAGTAFVGFSKQTGRSYPPRLITFQFNINQGLALEFGNQYMRVISNGAFVTEAPLAITGITRANPAVVTLSPTTEITAASPNNGAVTSSYAPGDSIVLAGGIFNEQGVLTVVSTKILSIQTNFPGTGGYAPGNTIHLSGGIQTTPAIVTVTDTAVTGLPTIASAGSGGTPGAAVVTGTTGTGTKFQANVTIGGGGSISSVDNLVIGGSYSVNPSNTNAEPVTGGGLSGAQLAIEMGVGSVSVTSAGVFTENSIGGNFTQASTSGSGVGATFSTAIMGISALSVESPGVYTVEPANPVAQASTTGAGLGATFTLTWGSATPFSNGDWIYLSGIVGMTELNGRTLLVAGATSSTVELQDVYGNNIDSTAYSAYISGGTAARIYTLATPYLEADLEYLKFTQSADVMSFCCWNQATGTSYPTQDLSRFADNHWTLTSPQFSATVSPPITIKGSASSSGTTYYNYVVTSVNPNDGSESIASLIANIPNAVDNSTTAGTITITWSAVSGIETYNIYKAPPNPEGAVPVGSLFGFAGTSYGTQFADSNIVANLDEVPPLHENPFAPGQVIDVPVTVGGKNYTQGTIGYTITTATGTGLVLLLVVVSGSLSNIIVQDFGEDYQTGDMITITDSGSGTGAAAELTIGAQSGTFPSVVSYFQQRRVYGATPNNPDTYFMSQPGAFTNFDSRIPTIDSDAIIGTPWSFEVNGIQFMVPMPGGLVVLTGLSAWQLTGAGGSSFAPQPITPSNQQAQPQAYNGCSATVPPTRIDYDIVYLQAKGSIWRDLSYNFYANIYTGADLTEISSHLFTGYTTRESAWCEEPFKVLWVVRNDGALLSLTYVKPQEVQGWARHDTNGLFQSVCSVTEPPVDALYTVVQRFPDGNNAYMIERMDNRLWSTAENSWCVDAGLMLEQTAPSATLTASSATGLGSLTGITGLIGGQNYSAGTSASVVDDNGQGPGTGAVAILTIVGGSITNVAFSPEGAGYTYPALVFVDPANTGSGASARPILNNAATFAASAAVFSSGDVGSVIRMGGGIATITTYTDSQHVNGNITSPIVQLIPNSGGQVLPQTSGNWTLTEPTTTVSGLYHLIGATVTGLADGNVITPQIVEPDGTITLSVPASAVIVGLGFTAQLQSTYLDAGSPTIQGQRKKISAVTARMESSRGIMAGANQIDGSTLSPSQLAPLWQNMDNVPDVVPGGVRAPYNSNFVPLYTGDRRITLEGGFQKPGQVAIQQSLPLPLQVLALIPEILPGDVPQSQFPPRQQQPGRATR